MNTTQATVNTVTGPVPVDELGVTLMHEHLIVAYPGWEADTLSPGHISSTLTLIRGTGGDLNAKSVIAEDLQLVTTFAGFLVEGPTNFEPSGTTYAMWVSKCGSNLIIEDNQIIGGTAGRGTDGSRGASGDEGGAGQKGTDAMNVLSSSCEGADAGNMGTDGDGGASTCSVPGGDGGPGDCPLYNCTSSTGNTQAASGFDGTDAPTGPGTGGMLGVGGFNRKKSGSSSCNAATSGIQCTGQNYGADAGRPGTDGTRGADAIGGQGCQPVDAAGMIGGDGHWTGGVGTDGGIGDDAATHGGSGGGGGAAGGVDMNQDCPPGDTVGASGGGGGAGGCAGSEGKAGGYGGGSFGLFVTFDGQTSTYPQVRRNAIRTGVGGAGGAGGAGGPGGIGGKGGLGGSHLATAWADVIGFGGTGGVGGDGGHGGGGGGACGGAAYGIYVHNYDPMTPPNWQAPTNTFIESGGPGQGGPGGSSFGVDGGDGADGVGGLTNL